MNTGILYMICMLQWAAINMQETPGFKQNYTFFTLLNIQDTLNNSSDCTNSRRSPPPFIASVHLYLWRPIYPLRRNKRCSRRGKRGFLVKLKVYLASYLNNPDFASNGVCTEYRNFDLHHFQLSVAQNGYPRQWVFISVSPASEDQGMGLLTRKSSVRAALFNTHSQIRLSF